MRILIVAIIGFLVSTSSYSQTGGKDVTIFTAKGACKTFNVDGNALACSELMYMYFGGNKSVTFGITHGGSTFSLNGHLVEQKPENIRFEMTIFSHDLDDTAIEGDCLAELNPEATSLRSLKCSTRHSGGTVELEFVGDDAPAKALH